MRMPITPFFAFFVFTTAAYGAAQPSVIIGGRPVPFEVKPYLNATGDLMAPVDAVQVLGAKYAPNADGTVSVTSAAGKSYSFRYTLTQGRYCVAFQKVAESLGASTDWQASAETLTVRARLQMVRQDVDALTVYTSYPVYYSVKHLDNPQRLYVDLYGLDLASAPASIPSASGAVSHIRSGQIDPETVRITIDLNRDLPFHVISGVQTNRVQVALGTAGDSAPAPVLPLPVTPKPVPPQIASVSITNVSYKVVSDTLTQIAVAATGPTPFRTTTLDSPNRLAFDLAGAALDKGLTLAQTISHPIIKDWRIGTLHTPQATFGRIVVDLSTLVGYNVTTEPQPGGGVTYLINLQTPPATVVETPLPPMPQQVLPVSGVSLAGKIIVVDPGHGGRDTGARDEFRTGQIYEKDITLAIGCRLRDTLTQAGATVLMTRDDDTLPSVAARPQFANAHHADLFVSIHCDSSGPQNSHAGTTVYFHAQNGVCRTMAADIGRRIGEVSGLPYNGVKSDTIRFVTGFGVLRGSLMPAVLVETGYMNNDDDLAKLRDDATQQHIAEGIVAGLRDFLADCANPVLQSARVGRAAPHRAM